MADFKVLEGGEGTKFNYYAIHERNPATGRETVVRTGKLNRPFRETALHESPVGSVAVDVDAKGFRLSAGKAYVLYLQDRKNGRKVEAGTLTGTVASKESRKVGASRVVRTDY